MGSAVRENPIWGLYIERWTCTEGFYQTIGKIIYAVKEKIRPTPYSTPEAWGLALRCWRVFDFHDFRSNGLLDVGLVQTKQAHAIGRIRMHPSLKATTDLVHAQRVIEELHALRRVDVHCLVLACRQFAAIVAKS